MLNIGLTIAKEIELKCFVKLHPQNSINDYPELFSADVGLLDKEEDSSASISNFDFTIMSGSSILLESLYVGTPVYRFIDGDGDDLFGELSVPVFSSEEELKKLIRFHYENYELIIERIKAIQIDLFNRESISKAYLSAFEELLDGNRQKS